jgi:hypothetical protein
LLQVKRRERPGKRDDIRARGACAMSTTRRISYERIQRLEAELLPRDWAILGMVERLHLVTGAQLVRVHWPEATDADLRAARRTLQRLTHWRLLARLERRMGGLGRGSTSWTYGLDVAGQRLLARRHARPRRPHLPRPAMWQHVLGVAEVYTRVMEATRGTDRRVLQWQGEPASWRRFTGSLGEALLVKPDAYVELDGPTYIDSLFLEIDMGTQSPAVIRRKLEGYRRYAATGVEQAEHGVFPRVVFLTADAGRQAQLVDLLAAQDPGDWRLFGVGLIHETRRLLVEGEV